MGEFRYKWVYNKKNERSKGFIVLFLLLTIRVGISEQRADGQ
jgi:hypothetical protein